MPTVILRDQESQQKLLSRFRKKVMRSGTLSQYRKKRWHMPKSEQKRVDQKKALRKMKKSQRGQEKKSYRF
ncbi:MAG: 30S ribosomal protein S21 [Anaerolineae bacterium]|nr:30S ribosomal protein S21 [Anaerolineae bacterium]